MNVLSAVLLLCAIDWYRPDGSLLGKGSFVYTADEATELAEDQVVSNPGYTYQIRCEDQ